MKDSTPQELIDRLGEEVFAEASGVLEMIAKTPRERELYEARLKLQRDEHARLQAAEDQGRAEGFEEGLVEGHTRGFQAGQIAGRKSQRKSQRGQAMTGLTSLLRSVRSRCQ